MVPAIVFEAFETFRAARRSQERAVTANEQIREWLHAGAYEKVFEAALAGLREKVFRLAFSILHDEAAAADATQEVFLKVWRALPEFECRSTLATWVYSIARNTCLDRAEQRSLRQEQPITDDEAAPPQNIDARRLVEELLGELPVEYRRVLTLYYLEDRSYAEVASLLNLPMGTVKTYLHRAKKQLGEIYGNRLCRI